MRLCNRKNSLFRTILLLLATIVWGTSFFILKETIESVPAFYVLTLRFLTSGLVLFFVFIKTNLKTDKKPFARLDFRFVFVGRIRLSDGWVRLHNTRAQRVFNQRLLDDGALYDVGVFQKKPKIYNVVSAVLCVLASGSSHCRVKAIRHQMPFR